MKTKKVRISIDFVYVADGEATDTLPAWTRKLGNLDFVMAGLRAVGAPDGAIAPGSKTDIKLDFRKETTP